MNILFISPPTKRRREMTTGKGTGMIERLLGELMNLSLEDTIPLFTRWMEAADPMLKIGIFTAWMRSEKDIKLKKTLFVVWMALERKNPKFLKDIVIKASAVCVTEGFASRDTSKMEGWMERVFEKDMTLKPSKVAHMAKNNFHLPQRMLPFLMAVARIIKERIRLRRRKQTTNSGEIYPRRRSSVMTRLLAEGTYSMNLSLTETEKVDRAMPVARPPLPDVLDESPSLDSRRRIEDYEALIAPYRPLLAEVASMEVLDELLRMLYEGGDVPSVVGWRGKTHDSEYMNLREHKYFLQILQGVSLYDHTYNVLKAALDIARDDLRQRHDFLLPSVITAALAHDIGKIPSLWQSSPIKKHDHESVGVARLEEMLASYGNEAFKKSAVTAVMLHHTGVKEDIEDTVARIILHADARAREYEITSSDPSFTVKPMAEWLNLTRLTEIILPAINELTIKNRRAVWKAMSFGGIVYCIPEYIREALKFLASEKKVLDYRLVRQSFKTDNRAVLAEFAHILKLHDYLAYNIGDGHFGLRFLFRSSIPGMRERDLYAIPVKGQLFPVKSSELEKKKTDYLKTVVSVRPVASARYY
jgi:CRISPR/Cas system-associated endonuclease Cas3-HD